MSAKDFGNKYVCFKCASKFYDLKKPEPICPKCGANQKDGTPVKPERKSRLAAVPKATAPVADVEPGAEPEEEVEEAEEVEEDI